MKILVFSPYYPPHIGGLESYADEFNKYLSEKKVAITVFTPRLPISAPESEIKYNNVHPVKSPTSRGPASQEFNGVKIIRFPAFEIISNYPLPKFWLPNFWHLFFGLFKEKFDIAISQTRFFNTSLLALIYAKIKCVRWIHIEHGSDFVKSGGKFSIFVAKIYDHTLGRIIFKFSDVNISISEAVKKFVNKFDKRNSPVIYSGSNFEKIDSVEPNHKIKEEQKDKIIITFIGRLIDGKGVSDLIRATKELKNENMQVFIIGDGPQRKNLEELSEEINLKNKITFFGHKNFEEAMGILKISDIFANPSYTEGLPTTVLEAALCRKAIVATNVGGTPEIITNGKSGFLIEPKNINLLKEKLEVLINNENLRKEFGNNAYAAVRNKFDWAKSIEKYLKIFTD